MYIIIKKTMKKILYLIVSIFLLTSCVKYEQSPLLSLSGEYRIDKVTYEEVDNTSSSNNMVYYPGDLYVNPSEKFPMDTIEVGFTRLHMDYSMMRFKPLNNPDGSVNWTKEYYYYVHGQTTQYSLGYIQVDIDGSTRTFKIVDDAAESLVLRTTGTWASGNAGSNVSVTMVMTRVGP
jgi:hypothetical protein